MNLIDFRNAIRLDMGVELVEFTDAEIDRSLQRAVGDVSRYSPLEKILDYTVLVAEVTEEVAIVTLGEVVSLTSRSIEPRSDVVTDHGGTVTYVRDTHYTMDYANGGITAISVIAPPATLVVKYKPSAVVIDLSSLEDNVLRVTKVAYPAGSVPETTQLFNMFSNQLMLLGAGGNTTQGKLQEGQHAWVFYHTSHTLPTVDQPGSFPDLWDEIISKGAGVYLLQSLIAKSTHDSVGDMASTRIALARLTQLYADIAALRILIASSHTKLDTTLNSSITPLIEATSALNGTSYYYSQARDAYLRVNVGGGAIEKATTDLNSVAAILVAAEAALNKVDGQVLGGSGSSKTALDSALSAATTASSDMDTARTVLNSSLTSLDKITTHLESASDSAKADLANAKVRAEEALVDLGEVNPFLDSTNGFLKDLIDAKAIWNSALVWLTLADTYLDSGSAKTDTVNVGDQVPANYARFAEVAIGAAQRFQDSRDVYLAGAQRKIEAAGALTAAATQHTTVSQRLIDSAQVRVQMATAFTQEAEKRGNTAKDHVALAAERVNLIQRYVEVARGRVEGANAFSQEAVQRLSEAEGKIASAKTWLDKGRLDLEEGNAFLAIASNMVQEGERRVAVSRGYADAAMARVTEVQHYVGELGQLIQLAQTIQAEAERWQSGVATITAFSSKVREEVTARQGEYLGLLGQALGAKPAAIGGR